MDIKLDENLSSDAAERFRSRGFEASTVVEQRLGGSPDDAIALKCKREGHAVVTLDLDFADTRLYPPSDYAGIIVLRLSRQGHDLVMNVIDRITSKLSSEPLTGKLWIVDEHRIRIRE